MIDFEEGETANFSSEFLQGQGCYYHTRFPEPALDGRRADMSPRSMEEGERGREEEAEDGLAIHPN